MLFKNPIIPGYNPDPSICRVGSDYYIVNSTFEFFPGVPVYHSKNLVNWELTGYCLDRRSQLELEDCRNSGGIYAPTIRYHKGMFYMITTNVTDKGNFVVHTEDINSEWSEPAWIDQGGIDPSLFFDDDDKCYYCSTGIIDGVRGIVAFEINPLTGVILSEKKLISEGCGGQCPEGPHIYKKDGWYYLMIAEGGTEYAHRETIQRSHNVYGPYEACPDNPVISHKEYKKSEIQATGHADLLEDDNGRYIGFYKHIHDMGVELERVTINNEDMNSKLLIKIDTDREKYTFSYAISDTANLGARVAYRQIGSGLNAGLSTEGTRTMTFTGTLFSLFAENGDGVFNIGVKLLINPDENYTL